MGYFELKATVPDWLAIKTPCLNILFRTAAIYLIMIALSANVVAETFVVKGRIEGMDKGWVYLNYLPGNGKMGVYDSCRVEAGHFRFKGEIAEPSRAWITTFSPIDPAAKYDAGNVVQFYLEGGKLSVYLVFSQFSKIRVEGCAAEKEWDKMERSKLPLTEKMRVSEVLLDEQGAGLPETTKDSLRSVIEDLQRKILAVDSLYIVEHPRSFVAADMLASYKHNEIAFPSLRDLYERFPAWIRNSSPGEKIREEVEQERVLYLRANARTFNALTSGGEVFRLDAWRGRKYVLLDFWASWCAPCRQITPFLKELRRQFGDSLEIVSIAIHDKDDAWRKALAEDKMEWIQVNDDSSSSISNMYHITTIPSLILFDKELKVVDKFGGWYNARREYELKKELEGRFGKKN